VSARTRTLANVIAEAATAAAAALISGRMARHLEHDHAPARAALERVEAAVAALEGYRETSEMRFAAIREAGPAASRVASMRGAWQPEVVYETGDVVAWNGSSWVYMGDSEESPSEPPGELWQLLAQRGQRGPRGRCVCEENR